MSRADFDKWETRYRKHDVVRGEPESFIVRAVTTQASLPTPRGTTVAHTHGAAVDIAGGLGRHALWLAENGWETTLLDIAPAGLAHADNAARRAGLPLRTIAADLDAPAEVASALPNRSFRLIVCAWFLPSPPLWTAMVSALTPGGYLIYVQPTLRNQIQHAHPSSRYLFPDGALGDHLGRLGLDVLDYQEGWDDRGHHTARAIGRASADPR